MQDQAQLAASLGMPLGATLDAFEEAVQSAAQWMHASQHSAQTTAPDFDETVQQAQVSDAEHANASVNAGPAADSHAHHPGDELQPQCAADGADGAVPICTKHSAPSPSTHSAGKGTDEAHGIEDVSVGSDSGSEPYISDDDGCSSTSASGDANDCRDHAVQDDDSGETACSAEGSVVSQLEVVDASACCVTSGAGAAAAWQHLEALQELDEALQSASVVRGRAGVPRSQLVHSQFSPPALPPSCTLHARSLLNMIGAGRHCGPLQLYLECTTAEGMHGARESKTEQLQRSTSRCGDCRKALQLQHLFLQNSTHSHLVLSCATFVYGDSDIMPVEQRKRHVQENLGLHHATFAAYSRSAARAVEKPVVCMWVHGGRDVQGPLEQAPWSNKPAWRAATSSLRLHPCTVWCPATAIGSVERSAHSDAQCVADWSVVFSDAFNTLPAGTQFGAVVVGGNMVCTPEHDSGMLQALQRVFGAIPVVVVVP